MHPRGGARGCIVRAGSQTESDWPPMGVKLNGSGRVLVVAAVLKRVRVRAVLPYLAFGPAQVGEPAGER